MVAEFAHPVETVGQYLIKLPSTKYLSLFILSQAYLLWNAVSYDGEILHADAYRPSAKHQLGFLCLQGLSLPKNDIFQKLTRI